MLFFNKIEFNAIVLDFVVVVFGKDDTLILKKVSTPTAKEVFEKVHKWGVAFAKKKGWNEENVMKHIHKGRGVKSE